MAMSRLHFWNNEILNNMEGDLEGGLQTIQQALKSLRVTSKHPLRAA